MLSYCPETGRITRNGRVLMAPSRSGYLTCHYQGKTCLQHRLAYLLQGIDIPAGAQVDHINGDRTDNRWCNLRLVSPSENGQNRIPKGCYYETSTGKWRAEIKIKGVKHRLGRFSTQQEATVAYASAKENIHTHNERYFQAES